MSLVEKSHLSSLSHGNKCFGEIQSSSNHVDTVRAEYLNDLRNSK